MEAIVHLLPERPQAIFPPSTVEAARPPPPTIEETQSSEPIIEAISPEIVDSTSPAEHNEETILAD